VLTRPQIYRISQFSWPTEHDWKHTTLFILYLAFMAFLTVGAISSMWWLRRDRGSSFTPDAKLPRSNKLIRIVTKPANIALKRIDVVAAYLERKIPERKRVIFGTSAVIFGVAWLFAPWFLGDPKWLGALPFRILPSVTAGGTALFFLTEPGVNPQRRRLTQLYFVLMCSSLLFGEVLWKAPDIWPGWFSFRLYSVWAIAFLTFALLATSMLVEYVVKKRAWLVVLATIAFLCTSAGAPVQPVRAKGEMATEADTPADTGM
jgi:hypothetical protein